MVAKTYRY